MKERLILALDIKEREAIYSLVKEVLPFIEFFKVGSVIFTRFGPGLVYDLKEKGCKVFLDLKYHDIPNTVYGACYQAAKIGVDMLTVHSLGGYKMMKSAMDGVKRYEDEKGKKGPLVLAVTILTSIGEEELHSELLIREKLKDVVLKMVENSSNAGIDGIVASQNEISLIKDFNKDIITVVPGIRPKWSEKNDQKRITTPYEAIKSGADYIVVGRPIYTHLHPKEAALKIVEEMDSAES
ncbi:MAG: orotidine-5'-phosphate decarboxylase [Deltaproteobacteria bacterium]|nr:orotidine-5'-phosphate decarboxylase [Deltaproteobacteria bacterium]